MIKKIALILFCFLLSASAFAQAVKNITVSGKESFTDHVSLKNDARDMDIIVKFVFDETNEALTLSLISYRNLFVFRDDVRYSQVKSSLSSKLKTERFPYVVAGDEGQQFRLNADFRKTFPKPRKKHVFRRWLDYDGLIPQPTEYQLVNDVIEQQFDIKNKQNMVSVTLRDIFLMEQDIKKKNTYWLVFGKDLNTQYRITLQRDPCLGKEQDIQEVRQTVASLQKALKPFAARYKGGVVHTSDMLKLFSDTKGALLQQFPHRTVESACPDLQQLWDAYNATVDTLEAMKCRLVELQEEPGESETIAPMKSGNVSLLLAKAHRIDALVSQWQLCDDKASCSDLLQACRLLITEGNNMIKEYRASTPEQQQAVRIFRNAEKHFMVTCKN